MLMGFGVKLEMNSRNDERIYGKGRKGDDGYFIEIVVSELIPNYVFHCISLHWVSYFLAVLLNHLRF